MLPPRETVKTKHVVLMRNAENHFAAWIGFAAVFFFALFAQSEDWPNWMGPTFDGVSNESGWSTEWPESGLETVWQNEIGIGFSSMSIAGDRLFTMGNQDGVESIWCFHKDTGKEIWRHSYDCKLLARLYEGGPGSTPTIVDDRLYATSKEGALICLNAQTGDVVWQVDLQSLLDVRLQEWGFNASPTVNGDQVLVEVGRLAAFNAVSGELTWKTDKHTSGYGSVRVFEMGDEQLLASLDCDGLRINRAIDGKELAFEPWSSPFRTNSTTPIIRGDKVFISTGYNVGCALLQMSNKDDGSIELSEVYASRKMRNHFNNSILYKGKLYGFDGNSNLGRVVHLTCMDFETGDIVWKHRGLGCGSLMIVDGKLLILSDDGRLVVAATESQDFEQLNEARILSGRCWSIPVFHDGHVYARNALGKLVCVKIPSAK